MKTEAEKIPYSHEKCPKCGSEGYMVENLHEGLSKECLVCGYDLTKKFKDLKDIAYSNDDLALQQYIDSNISKLLSQRFRAEERYRKMRRGKNYQWAVSYAAAVSGYIGSWMIVLVGWKAPVENALQEMGDIVMSFLGGVMLLWIVGLLAHHLAADHVDSKWRFGHDLDIECRKVSVASVAVGIGLVILRIVLG